MIELLFENLQLMSNTSKVEESNVISPRMFNIFKSALNNDNPYKDEIEFGVNIPDINDNKYNFELRVTCAPVKDSDDRFYVRYGNGVTVATYAINVIDEKFELINSDEITRAADNVIKYYNIEVSSDELIDTFKIALSNLEQVFNQKNFYYRLSNLRNRIPVRDFIEKNENIESKTEEVDVLTEDFDPSMPTWLMKAIRQERSRYNHNTATSNYPLDTMKWEITEPPVTGKLPAEINDVIACLIDVSGDKDLGQYKVYAPKLGIGYEETITVNNRDRKISLMSMKALTPYIKEYAVAKDVSSARDEVRNKKLDRDKSTTGSINRVDPEQQNDFFFRNMDIDKSGYVVDPEKYKKLLASMKSNEYSDRLDDLYIVLTNLKQQMKDFVNADDFFADGKSDEREYTVGYSTKSKHFPKMLEAYNSAVSNYKQATNLLDNIKNGTSRSEWFNTPAYLEFTSKINAAESKCADIIKWMK